MSLRFLLGVPLKSGLVAILLTPSLLALNPGLSLNQYLHTSWTQEEGNALPPIQTIAQASDGYLWLGWNKGLMRFDGMRFTEPSAASGGALPTLNVGWLQPAASGSLWVGSGSGLCHEDHGRVSCPTSNPGLPCPLILSMVQERSGNLWLLDGCSSGNTLARLSADGSVRTFDPKDGLPGQGIRIISQDHRGNLWLGTTAAVCRWSPGTKAVCSKGPVLRATAMVEDGEGRMVVADGDRHQVFRLSDDLTISAGPTIADAEFSRAMICDRDGDIWLGTMGQGLLRIGRSGVDRMARSDGLSNNLVSGLVEDHEGDIWVATARGVDRFRDPAAQIFSTLNGLSGDVIDTVYSGHEDGVWVGTAHGLDRLAGGGVTVFSTEAGLPGPTVLSTYEDPAHKLWVATGSGLAVGSGDRFVEVRTADGQHLDHVFNISGDSTGSLWLGDTKRGLFAVRGGVARAVEIPMQRGDAISSLLVRRNGETWLGHYGGGITVICRDAPRKHYDSRDGLGGGPVRALYEDRDGAVWVGTGEGLSCLRNARWTAWRTAQGLPEGGVLGVVDDEAGGLWLTMPAGVVRLARKDLEPPAKPLRLTVLGRSEGLRMGNSMANPRLTRSRDGRIWVCTEDGVAAIDPARVRSNPIPPPVAIEQVVADGTARDPAQRTEAAFRGHDLQIVYTGISLMAAEQVRFRYRLEGSTTQWTDAGTRRNVAYMNLAPGHYRFQVIASNNDGLWNNDGASIALRVDPYFYQTWWFLLLCLLSTLMMVWLAHRLKVRAVVSRLELIAAERVRFSRELHDSLLQGFSGVVYLLEAASRQFDSAPQASKQRLDRALDQADQSLREARQMIGSMRIPALENHTLAEALRATVGQMMSGMGVDFQFEVKGRVQQAPYNVEANLFLLAREAVTNSLNHASASRICLTLAYAAEELRVTVEDDGKGFDPEAALSKAGHWGFRGMRERARAIGGDFQVHTAPGHGSTIQVSVPLRLKK